MLIHLFTFFKNFGSRIKQWVKPTTATLVTAPQIRSTTKQAINNQVGGLFEVDHIGHFGRWPQFLAANCTFSLSFPALAWQLFDPKLPSDW